MAIASAGGGKSNVYSLPTVRLQAVGKAIHASYRLNNQYLSESAIAQHIADNYSMVRLHRLQFFHAKNSPVDAKNNCQSGQWLL
ncbi:hypothetical protein [Nostoc sp.]|uniref:hypothetical protein n=1 Tax=Nostoc sp. TaxID=1180 RepID=UPI002FF441D5